MDDSNYQHALFLNTPEIHSQLIPEDWFDLEIIFIPIHVNKYETTPFFFLSPLGSPQPNAILFSEILVCPQWWDD